MSSKPYHSHILLLIIKLAFFVSPFILMLCWIFFAYEKSGGDLSRLGKISVAKNYRVQFEDDFNLIPLAYRVSEYDSLLIDSIDVFTIGDSFSQQPHFGYQNILAHSSDLTILNFDHQNFNIDPYNPIAFLKASIEGELLNELDVKYIVLQIVVRDFVRNSVDLDAMAPLDLNRVSQLVKTQNSKQRSGDFGIQKSLNDAPWYVINTIGYYFDDCAFSSEVYQMSLSKPLFSANDDKLVFYDRDILTMKRNTLQNIKTLNDTLNALSLELKNKNIQLIVLPIVDKYDLYEPYINSNPYAKNQFFELLRPLAKDYVFIDSKTILDKELEKGTKDVFFADDSHWSPLAASIIAKHLLTELK